MAVDLSDETTYILRDNSQPIYREPNGLLMQIARWGLSSMNSTKNDTIAQGRNQLKFSRGVQNVCHLMLNLTYKTLIGAFEMFFKILGGRIARLWVCNRDSPFISDTNRGTVGHVAIPKVVTWCLCRWRQK